MTHYYAFNGDADGLCALQQLRLAGAPSGPLVTGVKRDIALLERVPASAGDHCTVLDVSLDVNRSGLLRLLEAGVTVRYFDHHFAGEIPNHAGLEAHIDPSPTLCTSLLVDAHLQGSQRAWAITGAFGDSLTNEAAALARSSGISDADAATLKELGVSLNYNAYGETVADLHIAPEKLAEELLAFPDPLEFAKRSPAFARLAEGYRTDMQLAHALAPERQVPGAVLFVMPDAVWARRAIGTFANELARKHEGSAVAIASPSGGNYVVSIRVPRDAPLAADEFCRRFPSGGGRRTAAGINKLPTAELSNFALAFESAFGQSAGAARPAE